MDLSELILLTILCMWYKERATRTIIEKHNINLDNHIFYDALILLGTPNQNQTKTPVRLVGYTT
jgi:hypothetical protein